MCMRMCMYVDVAYTSTHVRRGADACARLRRIARDGLQQHAPLFDGEVGPDAEDVAHRPNREELLLERTAAGVEDCVRPRIRGFGSMAMVVRAGCAIGVPGL